MPFVKRSVEPRYLSRKPLDNSVVNDELEAVTNATLVEALKQLACLVLFADEIFQELTAQVKTIQARTEGLRAKLENVDLVVAKLNAKEVAVPEGTLSEPGRPRHHYVSSQPLDKGFFCASTRPAFVHRLYSAAVVSPVQVMRQIDRYRQDGRRSSKCFLCLPFFKDVKVNFDVEIEMRRPASLSTAPRDWLSDDDTLDSIVFSTQLSNQEREGSSEGEGSSGSSLSEEDVLRQLPTPEEKTYVLSLKYPYSDVPIDVTGTGFRRMTSLRRSFIQQMESMTKRKKRGKRRSTVTGGADNKDVEAALNKRNVALSTAGTQTGECEAGTSGRGGHVCFEDADPKSKLDSLNRSKKGLLRKSKSGSEEGSAEQAQDGPSGFRWFQRRSRNRNSIIGGIGIYEELDRVKKTRRGLLAALLPSPDKSADSSPSKSSTDSAVAVAPGRRAAAKNKNAKNRSSLPISTLSQPMSTAVKLRQNAARGCKEDGGQSSSGNWSASSSTRTSMESEEPARAAARSPDMLNRTGSQTSLSKDSALSDRMTPSDERWLDSVNAGYQSDSTHSSSRPGFRFTRRTVKTDTARWLRSLEEEGALGRSAGGEAADAASSTGTITPRAHRRALSPLPCMDDGESSEFSVDNDGYYTSMHTDSGLRTLPIRPAKASRLSDLREQDQASSGSQSSVCSLTSSKKTTSGEDTSNKDSTDAAHEDSPKKVPPPPPPRTSTLSRRADQRDPAEKPSPERDTELSVSDSVASSAALRSDAAPSDSEAENSGERLKLKTTITTGRIPALCVVTPSPSDDEEDAAVHGNGTPPANRTLPKSFGRSASFGASGATNTWPRRPPAYEPELVAVAEQGPAPSAEAVMTTFARPARPNSIACPAVLARPDQTSPLSPSGRGPSAAPGRQGARVTLDCTGQVICSSGSLPRPVGGLRTTAPEVAQVSQAQTTTSTVTSTQNRTGAYVRLGCAATTPEREVQQRDVALQATPQNAARAYVRLGSKGATQEPEAAQATPQQPPVPAILMPEQKPNLGQFSPQGLHQDHVPQTAFRKAPQPNAIQTPPQMVYQVTPQSNVPAMQTPNLGRFLPQPQPQDHVPQTPPQMTYQVTPQSMQMPDQNLNQGRFFQPPPSQDQTPRGPPRQYDSNTLPRWKPNVHGRPVPAFPTDAAQGAAACGSLPRRWNNFSFLRRELQPQAQQPLQPKTGAYVRLDGHPTHLEPGTPSKAGADAQIQRPPGSGQLYDPPRAPPGAAPDLRRSPAPANVAAVQRPMNSGQPMANNQPISSGHPITGGQLMSNGSAVTGGHQISNGQSMSNGQLMSGGHAVPGSHPMSTGRQTPNGHPMTGRQMSNGIALPSNHPMPNGHQMPNGQPISNHPATSSLSMSSGQLMSNGNALISGHQISNSHSVPRSHPIPTGHQTPNGHPMISRHPMSNGHQMPNGQLIPGGHPSSNGQLIPGGHPSSNGQPMTNSHPMSNGHQMTNGPLVPGGHPSSNSHPMSNSHQMTNGQLIPGGHPSSNGQPMNNSHPMSSSHPMSRPSPPANFRQEFPPASPAVTDQRRMSPLGQPHPAPTSGGGHPGVRRDSPPYPASNGGQYGIVAMPLMQQLSYRPSRIPVGGQSPPMGSNALPTYYRPVGAGGLGQQPEERRTTVAAATASPHNGYPARPHSDGTRIPVRVSPPPYQHKQPSPPPSPFTRSMSTPPGDPRRHGWNGLTHLTLGSPTGPPPQGYGYEPSTAAAAMNCVGLPSRSPLHEARSSTPTAPRQQNPLPACNGMLRARTLAGDPGTSVPLRTPPYAPALSGPPPPQSARAQLLGSGPGRISPPRSTMSTDDLFAAIHSSKKRMNVKTDLDRSLSPSSSRSSSPAFSVSSLSSLKGRRPEQGSLTAGDRRSWAGEDHLAGSPGDRRSWASDRLGPTRPTSMRDFKLLLLQAGRSSPKEASPVKRPSASEMLRSASPARGSPAKPTGTGSPVRPYEPIRSRLQNKQGRGRAGPSVLHSRTDVLSTPIMEMEDDCSEEDSDTARC